MEEEKKNDNEAVDRMQEEKNIDQIPYAVLREKSRFSIIWLLPIIVALLGAWLVYTSYMQRGMTIEIIFSSGEGIEKGKTLVKYKGVEIGYVEHVDIDKNDNIAVKVKINKSMAHIAKKNTKFWLVRPEIGGKGVTGLETIMTGAYIGVLPGNGKSTLKFKAIDNAPHQSNNVKNLKIILTADRLGSIISNSPVYYRQIQVGEVVGYELSKNADLVNITVSINHEYAKLVHKNTKFWNASGFKGDFGLFSGVKLNMESILSLFSGGIAFATPDNKKMGPQAKNGKVFILNDNSIDEWLQWKPKIKLNIKK